MKKILAILILINAMLLDAMAIDPVIRVDFNVGKSRNASETNEPGYQSWGVDNTPAAPFGNTYTGMTATISGVTISLSGKAEGNNAPLETYWTKVLVQTPYFARFANDGIFVKQDNGGDKGGEITMKLEGLKTGTHTIMLFFNSTDNPSNTFAPIDIYIDEAHKARVTPTCQVTKNTNAAYTFVTFVVTATNPVVIRMTADVSATATKKNVYLCGFELNVPDAKMQIRDPFPANLDEHFNADNGTVNLRWTDAETAGIGTFDVYWGIDSATVENADNTSPVFRGSQWQLEYTLTDVKRMNTYYWRIDVVRDGVTTKGKLLMFRPRVLAFPEAEGYGRYARGGRGGKVVYVTNLKGSGAGSLAEATTNDIGPRYILFAVSGRIHTSGRLTLGSSYVTVAAQTAPGKGICVSGGNYGITGDDVIVRFMRVRVGQFGTTIDGMGMTGANYSMGDHNSISWTHDEAFSSRGGKNFTLQNTLISEALNAANHKNYDYGKTHGFAGSIGGDTASFLRMLLAHCEGRNWSLAGGLSGDGYYAGHLEIANNIVYNYGGRVTDGGAHEVNFVNNYYKQGKHSTTGMLVPQHEAVGLGTQKYYAKGNVLEAYNNGNYGTFICNGTELISAKCGCENSQWASSQTRYEDFVNAPFFLSHATILPAKHAFKTVLSDCGATMPALDEHDLRVILEARDGTWKYKGSKTGQQGMPDHHLDVGGYERYDTVMINLNEFDTDRDGLPNWWEVEVSGTDPNGVVGDFTDTNTDPDNDGMTHIERYLEWMATPHLITKTNSQIAVDLRQYTRGYTNTPVYSVVGNGDGVVTISGNWARFQPAIDFKGVTYFEFKVTDSDGDSMVRKMGVRVKE